MCDEAGVEMRSGRLVKYQYHRVSKRSEARICLGTNLGWDKRPKM